MRMHSRFAFYTAVAVLCAAGILSAVVSDVWAGKSMLPGVPGSTAEARATQTPLPASAGYNGTSGGATIPDGVISADTSIFWVTRYLKCGHEIVREKSPDAQMVGRTYLQFAACYPAYRMEVVNGVIRMLMEYDQYCPDHYVIKADDNGVIYVYRNMDGKEKLTVVMRMSFTVDAVPPDYRPLLKDGMAFASVEEIEGLIEDAET
jgi:hypothetical protein